MARALARIQKEWVLHREQEEKAVLAGWEAFGWGPVSCQPHQVAIKLPAIKLPGTPRSGISRLRTMDGTVHPPHRPESGRTAFVPRHRHSPPPKCTAVALPVRNIPTVDLPAYGRQNRHFCRFLRPYGQKPTSSRRFPR